MCSSYKTEKPCTGSSRCLLSGVYVYSPNWNSWVIIFFLSAPDCSLIIICFSVLALQESDSISCLCCWLLACLPDAAHKEVLRHFPLDTYRHQWTLQDVDIIVSSILLHCSICLLQDGLQIFDPVSKAAESVVWVENV